MSAVAYLVDYIKITPTVPGSGTTAFSFHEEIVGATPKQVFVLPLPYAPGKNSIVVIIDGIEQSLLAGHYAETNPTTITLASAVDNVNIKFRWW